MQGIMVVHIFNFGKYSKIANSANVHNDIKSNYATFLIYLGITPHPHSGLWNPDKISYHE